MENPEIVERLTAPHGQAKSKFVSIWIARASVVLGNMLGFLLNYFDADVPVRVNVIIVTVTFILVLLLFFLNRMLNNNIYHIVDVNCYFVSNISYAGYSNYNGRKYEG